eukprot:CAMPEP_0114253672 /NCGR_PEP_ID=MMETSP0058-20121206/16520_1 /TAXON_ID=36894 /ORGANISM="Pyramimonas parkeae, CCMP726" /LENGTH=260 /DNA_ID=CAMNT_0001367739 /DNA_START=119 /DNA_END=901 /DNA_ORIENTATION=-
MDTYYDSQSGRRMAVPGAAGIRVHEISPSGWTASESSIDERLAGLRSILEHGVSSVEIWRDYNSDEVEHIGRWLVSQSKPCKLAARVSDVSMCQLHDAGFHEVVIEVVCSNGFKENLLAATQLTQAADKIGIQVRANITHAFDGSDGVENKNLPKVQEAIMALADSGAYTIVVADTLGMATEDTMREAVDEAFYLDVVGDTMLERLGVRAAGPVCQVAVRLGIQHYDTWTGKNVDPNIVNARELAGIFQNEGKQHRLLVD